MKRQVQPEILDGLPPEDPAAIRSRRELRRVNAWMGHPRLLAAALGSEWPRAPRLILSDLGTGDGSLLLAALSRRPPAPGVNQLLLVDRQPVVNAATLAAFRARGWRPTVIADEVHTALNRADLRADDARVGLANLFLHHFDDRSLSSLLGLIARNCTCFVACEPRRSSWARFATRLLALIGCGPVTRHDAWVSVAAGFRDQELTVLGRAFEGWQVVERSAGLFSHLFIAHRHPPNGPP